MSNENETEVKKAVNTNPYFIKPLEYAGTERKMVDAQFVSFKPPTPKNIQNIAPVRCEVLNALKWVQEQSGAREDEVTKEGGNPTSEEMMMTLELAVGVDVGLVIANVCEILTGPGKMALLDGEEDTRLNKPLWEDLSIEDVYGITGQYVANFILPSLS